MTASSSPHDPTDPADPTDPSTAGDYVRRDRYAAWLQHDDPAVTANAMLCLIHQANYRLDQQIIALEQVFIEGGGYSEQLAAARIARRNRDRSDRTDQTDRNFPDCPLCGKGMALRTARQGKNQGSQFWGVHRLPGMQGNRASRRPQRIRLGTAPKIFRSATSSPWPQSMSKTRKILAGILSVPPSMRRVVLTIWIPLLLIVLALIVFRPGTESGIVAEDNLCTTSPFPKPGSRRSDAAIWIASLDQTSYPDAARRLLKRLDFDQSQEEIRKRLRLSLLFREWGRRDIAAALEFLENEPKANAWPSHPPIGALAPVALMGRGERSGGRLDWLDPIAGGMGGT